MAVVAHSYTSEHACRIAPRANKKMLHIEKFFPLLNWGVLLGHTPKMLGVLLYVTTSFLDLFSLKWLPPNSRTVHVSHPLLP